MGCLSGHAMGISRNILANLLVSIIHKGCKPGMNGRVPLAITLRDHHNYDSKRVTDPAATRLEGPPCNVKINKRATGDTAIKFQTSTGQR